MKGTDNFTYAVELVDTGTQDANGNELYVLGVNASVSVTVGTVNQGTPGASPWPMSLPVPSGDASASPSAPLQAYNGASWDRVRTPVKYYDLNAVAIGTISAVATPGSGKKIRLMGGSISVSNACSVLFEDNSAGHTVIRTPQLLANTPYAFDLGNGVLLGNAGDVLTGTASVASTTITGHLYGVEE
jgi:hypothetical protein